MIYVISKRTDRNLPDIKARHLYRGAARPPLCVEGKWLIVNVNEKK